jgi:hypothetical protein
MEMMMLTIRIVALTVRSCARHRRRKRIIASDPRNSAEEPAERLGRFYDQLPQELYPLPLKVG